MNVIVNNILMKMSSVRKHHRVFIILLFTALSSFRGKATFRNMSRYSSLSEKSFYRWYKQQFDFTTFNNLLLSEELKFDQNDKIAAIDASFMKKSGKHTYGLGMFFNGTKQKSEKGLEISAISIIDLESNTGYTLDVKQTHDNEESRTVEYLNQVKSIANLLKAKNIKYLVGDAYYSKASFVNGVCDSGLDFIGKLRSDSNLKWLYDGQYSGSGRPKKYSGKVNVQIEKSKLTRIRKLKNGLTIYSGIVYSPCFKRNIRIVVLNLSNNKDILLYSTDQELNPEKIFEYYKARFQIEFIFRDAKQHTGLMDCQARSEEAIHTQINASMTTLNLLKIEDKNKKKTSKQTVISIASWKRLKFNQNLIQRVFCKLGFDLSSNKVTEVYDELSQYGTISY
jgi:hypothetical protein